MTFSSRTLGALLSVVSFLALTSNATASTLFAVTSGSKLFRSTDGANWEHVSDLDGATIVVRDPTNPSTVLVEANAISSGGGRLVPGNTPKTRVPSQRYIFRSTDGGQTWTLYPLTVGFTTLAFAVGETGTVYFASGASSTLYRSVDGGNTFQAGGSVGNISAITTDPRQAGVVYASVSGVSGAGIYKSTDDGKSFSLLSNKLGTLNMPLAQIFGVAVDTKNGSLYVAATGTCANIVECGLFRSTDDGKTWSDVKAAGRFRNVVYDARTDTLYAGGQVRATPEHGTVVKSTDGGGTWSTSDSGLTFMGAQVFLDPSDASLLYSGEPGTVSGFDDDQFSANAPLGGVFVSSNGAAWSFRDVDASTNKVQDRVVSFAALPASGGSGAGCGIGVPVISSIQSLTDFGSFPYFAAGSWLEIKGVSLAGGKRLWTGDDFSGSNAPTNLDGTSAFINSKNTYVYYISSTQIDVQAPADPATGSAKITVSNCAGASLPFTLEKRAVAPGLLAPASFHVGDVRTGVQYLVALFPDTGEYVGNANFIPGVASRPAKPGDRIITYGVGFGDVVPAIAPGVVVAGGNNVPNLTIKFGSTPATVEYAGLVPGNIGLYQFNVVVPDVADGNQQVIVTVNGVTVPQTVYLTIHR